MEGGRNTEGVRPLQRLAGFDLLVRVQGCLRILFAFDPRRTAILLIGGDKANDWAGWYRTVSSYIEALDGHLKLVAEFPDGPVTIDVRPE
jgi:hypothetical protein